MKAQMKFKTSKRNTSGITAILKRKYKSNNRLEIREFSADDTIVIEVSSDAKNLDLETIAKISVLFNANVEFHCDFDNSTKKKFISSSKKAERKLSFIDRMMRVCDRKEVTVVINISHVDQENKKEDTRRFGPCACGMTRYYQSNDQKDIGYCLHCE